MPRTLGSAPEVHSLTINSSGQSKARFLEEASISKPPRSVPNRELVTYALFLAGGDSRHIHTEEVALRSFDLFPASFSWVKYPIYPDKDIVRVALTDARKASHGALVSGRAGQRRGLTAKTNREPVQDGWILTAPGVEWVRENLDTLESLVGSKGVKSHRQQLLKQLKRFRDHQLFQQYSTNPLTFLPAIGVLADLLRCRVDAEPDVWTGRFERVLRQAESAGQTDLQAFLLKCRDAYTQQA